MLDVNSELDRLLETLEPAAGQGRADAIDEINQSAPRRTAARSLREDEVVRRFREEVSSGLMRVDTVRQLLGLIRVVLEGRSG